MAKELKLYTMPEREKLLRAENKPVKLPLSDEIKELIEDMKLTVLKAPGVGLAAPQVGKNLQIAVINLEKLGPPFAIINPKIAGSSIKKTVMEEGCLSVPHHYAEIKRPKRVEVMAFTEDGRKALLKADKLLAKVLQHEIDHLNGVLIIDKAA